MSTSPYVPLFSPRLDLTSQPAVWPSTLVLCALYNTLHSATYAGIGPREGITRERFFTYSFLAATLWCTSTFAPAQTVIGVLRECVD